MKTFFCNDRVMLHVIVLNALMIFVCGFWTEHVWIDVADCAFTLLFLMEAAVKIKALGWREYWRSRWNRFDFIILILALPSLADPFVDAAMTTNVLLTLRTLRIFKSFRLFRHVPNIQKLMRGAVMALHTSSLVCVAFVVFLVIFATLSSAMFGTIVPEYFGNPGLSLYSTFRLFTIEGWYELPDTIAQNSSTLVAVFARIYFAVLLFLGGIIGMSLVNSIFVDAMAADNNDEVMHKLEDIEREIKELKNTNQTK